MSYAAVTKSNITYQPRENIKTLLQNNFTYKTTQIYSYFPDQKAASFKGFPFIVIPDPDMPEGEKYIGTSVHEYSNIMEGSIYHKVSSLGDNKLRTLKQDIVQTLNSRANQSMLEGYGTHIELVEFGQSSPDPLLLDQEEVIEVPFTVSFLCEVDFT